ncbi:MAG TPA: RNA-binding cell elongation regulator Jag/EloR [Candidatus Limnocylindria bacterium]
MSPIRGDEFTGRTVEEAIERGLRELGKRRDQVDIEILAKGKPANMLGLGGEDARVLLSYEESDVEEPQPSIDERDVPRRPMAQRAEPEDEEEATPAFGEELPMGGVVAKDLLEVMGVEADVKIEQIPGREGVEVSGSELGVLIGRGGENLVALQQVISAITSKRVGHTVHVPIDVEGYRRRREDQLREVAHRVADRVRATGQAVTLEPMLAYERRIVHLAVQGTAGLRTESVGSEPNRRVVISSTAPGARGPIGMRPPFRGGPRGPVRRPMGPRRTFDPRDRGGYRPRYGRRDLGST